MCSLSPTRKMQTRLEESQPWKGNETLAIEASKVSDEEKCVLDMALLERNQRSSSMLELGKHSRAGWHERSMILVDWCLS